MPTYDYLCPNGHRFEVIHGVTADGPAACPICGASPVRKAISAPSIVFKGSGWAKKDFRDSKSKAAKSATSGTKDASGTKGASGDSGSAGESGSKGESAVVSQSGEGAGASGKEGTSTSATTAD